MELNIDELISIERGLIARRSVARKDIRRNEKLLDIDKRTFTNALKLRVVEIDKLLLKIQSEIINKGGN